MWAKRLFGILGIGSRSREIVKNLNTSDIITDRWIVNGDLEQFTLCKGDGQWTSASNITITSAMSGYEMIFVLYSSNDKNNKELTAELVERIRKKWNIYTWVIDVSYEVSSTLYQGKSDIERSADASLLIPVEFYLTVDMVSDVIQDLICSLSGYKYINLDLADIMEKITNGCRMFASIGKAKGANKEMIAVDKALRTLDSQCNNGYSNGYVAFIGDSLALGQIPDVSDCVARYFKTDDYLMTAVGSGEDNDEISVLVLGIII